MRSYCGAICPNIDRTRSRDLSTVIILKVTPAERIRQNNGMVHAILMFSAPNKQRQESREGNEERTRAKRNRSPTNTRPRRNHRLNQFMVDSCGPFYLVNHIATGDAPTWRCTLRFSHRLLPTILVRLVPHHTIHPQLQNRTYHENGPTRLPLQEARVSLPIQ